MKFYSVVEWKCTHVDREKLEYLFLSILLVRMVTLEAIDPAQRNAAVFAHETCILTFPVRLTDSTRSLRVPFAAINLNLL